MLCLIRVLAKNYNEDKLLDCMTVHREDCLSNPMKTYTSVFKHVSLILGSP